MLNLTPKNITFYKHYHEQSNPGVADKTYFRDIVIDSDEGIKLSATIGEPPEKKPIGTIIFVHGFGGNKFENGLFTMLAKRCLSIGFLTVLYDWRGIGSSEGDFKSTAIENHVSDFTKVVEWVRSRSNEYKQPVCAVGFSLGAAIVGLSFNKTQLDCISYLSPAVRPSISMWPRYNSTEVWQSIKNRGFIEKEGSSVLIGQSILESLRDTDLGLQAFVLPKPLLVCHGKNDKRIDCAHTREIFNNSKHNAPLLQYHEIPGASHSFRPTNTNWPKISKFVAKWFYQKVTSANIRITSERKPNSFTFQR